MEVQKSDLEQTTNELIKSKSLKQDNITDSSYQGEENGTFRKKKRRRGRNRPYSAKHFLGRPKINAPANTTQFLCDDKEYYCGSLPEDDSSCLNASTSNSESESSFNTSSSVCAANTSSYHHNDDDASYQSIFFDDDRFFTEEFDQVYDNIRAELLRSESVEELTSRCIELESAIHNLRYLLQKETKTRQQYEQMFYLTQLNDSLLEENQNLLQNQDLSAKEEHKLTKDLNEISINNTIQSET